MSKNQLLVMGWEIVLYDSSTAANRLQALAHDYYSKYIMDLTTNSVVKPNAIKYIQGLDQLNKT
jgi:hypothetical protein